VAYPVAYLETEPGTTADQLYSPMFLCIASTKFHMGEYPQKARPENELFPFYIHPPAPSPASAASSQRALVEAGKACYEALNMAKDNVRAIDLTGSEIRQISTALAAYTAALDAAGRGEGK